MLPCLRKIVSTFFVKSEAYCTFDKSFVAIEQILRDLWDYEEMHLQIFTYDRHGYFRSCFEVWTVFDICTCFSLLSFPHHKAS